MKNFTLVLLIVSFCFNLLYVVKLRNVNSRLDECNYSINKNETDLTKLTDTYIGHYEFEGRRIKAKNSTLDTLITILSNGPKLFLSFNQESCEGCVGLALSELKKIGEKIGNNNIIILTNFENKRDPKSIGDRFDNRFKVLNYKSADDFYVSDIYPSIPPNFFILDSSFTVKLFFIYAIDHPALNEGYFKKIDDYFKRD